MTALSPEPGRIALVRQRRYLVENVTPSPSRDDSRALLGYLPRFMQRHPVKPEAEDAAKGLKRIRPEESPRCMLRRVSVLPVTNGES